MPFKTPRSLSLRQTLFVGAGLGILLPALVLGYFQFSSRLEAEVNMRVRAPMLQYADVLASGIAVAVWNVDKGVANELVEAVMRNPDVVNVTVMDEHKDVFVRKQNPALAGGSVLTEERDINYNAVRVGHLRVELTSARVEREMLSDLLKLAMGLAAQVLISIAAIWWLFDRRMVQPLRSLQQGALRLASGDLQQAILRERDDEIGQLAGNMDSMRTDLAALISERDEKTAALQRELEQRLQTQEALSVSQAKFVAIFDASPSALAVSRMDESFHLVDVNASWIRLFGRSREAVVGRNGAEIGMWARLDERTQALARLDRTGELAGFLAHMQPEAGRAPILCEVSGRVIMVGNDRLLITAYDDVTAKHKYEENILQLNATLERRVEERTSELSDALKSLTAAQSELVRTEKLSALGSLVAGIAHELNTPIGNSLTVASTLQDHTKTFTSDMEKGLTKSRLEEFVASTRQGAGILMRSLQQAAELVSSFKRVAVDQTSVNRRRFLLDETVKEILLTLGPMLRKTTHQVDVQVPPDISLEGYPGPLGQVLTNLINNAILHGFDGRQNGLITISAVLDGTSWVTLRVQDNGAGIPIAHVSRVFDPFFTTKLGQGGSGLGLNIVYNLVTNVLGGTVRVDSPPGTGACFVMRLPLTAPVNDATVEV